MYGWWTTLMSSTENLKFCHGECWSHILLMGGIDVNNPVNIVWSILWLHIWGAHLHGHVRLTCHNCVKYRKHKICRGECWFPTLFTESMNFNKSVNTVWRMFWYILGVCISNEYVRLQCAGVGSLPTCLNSKFIHVYLQCHKPAASLSCRAALRSGDCIFP